METQYNNTMRRTNNLLYFSVSDLCKNRTAERFAIDNRPNEEQRKNIEELIVNILDPAFGLLWRTINIECGFVCERLNSILKFGKDSPLLSGCGVIISCDNADELYEILTELEHDILLFTTEKTLHGFSKNKILVSYKKGENKNINKKEVIYKNK